MAFRFKKHEDLEGRHAILSASKYSWTNYSLEKFEDMFRETMTTTLGTRLHELAKEHILLQLSMPKNQKTINKYINDCIGMRMIPEQVIEGIPGLAFGTADAIRFDMATKTLYIFDLKNGVHEASFKQLMIYGVFFAEEYGYRVGELNYELRIYQNDEVRVHVIDPEHGGYEDLVNIHSRLIDFSARAIAIRKEALQ